MALQDIINVKVIELLDDAANAARHADPFDLPENHFIRMFRLNKEMVQEIINLVEERTSQPSRKSALNAQVKVSMEIL